MTSQIPIDTFRHFVESLPRGVEIILAAKGENSILVPMVLEWDVQQAHEFDGKVFTNAWPYI